VEEVLMVRKQAHKPSEPVPYFNYEFGADADGCEGLAWIECGCGEQLHISISRPTRCPGCRRVFILRQASYIMERDEGSLNICPFCNGIRYDNLKHGMQLCTECSRDEDGRTREDRHAEMHEWLRKREQGEGV